jgi:hypothetical protein
MNDPHLPDELLFADVRRATDAYDPLPDGMVERMVAVTRDIADHDPDLELQLMLVVERFAELVGTRGGARSYTLRFGGEGVDLLVRVGVSEEEGRARLDGWVVPAASAPVQIHEVGGEGRTFDGMAADSGRFEFPDLPTGSTVCPSSSPTTRRSAPLPSRSDHPPTCHRGPDMPELPQRPPAREPRMPRRATWTLPRPRILDPERGPVVDGVKGPTHGLRRHPADDRQG